MSTDAGRKEVLKKISTMNKFDLFRIEGFVSCLLAGKNMPPANRRRPLLTKEKGASM